MENVVKASPGLARLPVFSKAASCKSIDVVSVRIWFDRIIPTRTPANVFSRFSTLRGAGGTFFMLDQLHNHELNELWGDEDKRGSVVACDFYNAGALITMTDQDILSLLTNDLLPSAVDAFAGEYAVSQNMNRKIVDLLDHCKYHSFIKLFYRCGGGRLLGGEISWECNLVCSRKLRAATSSRGCRESDSPKRKNCR
jgi:hypothetical protein